MKRQSIGIYLYADNMVIGYKRHKVKVLLAGNQGSTLFADGDTPNAIVTYNFWRKHRLIAIDPNRPRHFRLDAINMEQLLNLNDA